MQIDGLVTVWLRVYPLGKTINLKVLTRRCSIKKLGKTINLKVLTRRCSIKKTFCTILQNSQENTCAGVLFLKERFQHRCFLWIYQHFAKHLLLKTPPGNCFCKFQLFISSSNTKTIRDSFWLWIWAGLL